ncbi:MAG: WecB/TagA/CpsF family glycosyltransferase [Clostridia bacterium]|nr:WecB/TagA/CpsF family glycosyltransferase [Clostridia bacterium]
MELNEVKILGVKIHKVTMNEAFNVFLNLINMNTCQTIFTPNTEIVMAAQEDKELKTILAKGDLVIPDGIGLIYASSLHHLGLEERVPGVEFMDKILKFCNTTKKSIYILGGKPGVAERAAENILEEYPNIRIKGTQDGYFSEEDDLKIIDGINDARPDILFVALGAPKQEKWISKHKKILNVKVAMGVGGSVDIWAGTAKRAPKFFIALNLEWFYRLLTNPSRIFRMFAIPKFMIKVLIDKEFSK